MSAADDAADAGNVKVIGRWHDLAGFTGVAIAETDDPDAMSKWALNWNGMLHTEVKIVHTDAETRAIGKEKFAL